MNIIRVRLSAFGHFQDAQVAFEPGLNLVLGPNEAGKSTVVEAIFGVLFGYKSDRERFMPKAGPGDYQAGVTFDVDGRQISFTRDFISNRVLVAENPEAGREKILINEKLSPTGKASDRAPYMQLVQELFGFTDPELFRAVTMVGQEELYSSWKQASLQIRSLLAGSASRDSDRVLKALENQYYDLTRFDPEGRKRMKKPRLMEKLNEQLQSLREDIASARQTSERHNRIASELAGTREELSQARNELGLQSRIIELGEELLHLKEQIEEHERRHKGLYQEMLQRRESEDKLGRIENDLQELSDVAKLTTTDFESAGKLLATRENLDRNKVADDDLQKKLDRQVAPKPLLQVGISLTCVVLGVLSAVFVSGSLKWFIMAILAIGLLGVWAWYSTQRGRVLSERRRIEEQLAATKTNYQDMRNAYTEDLNRLPEPVRDSIDDLDAIRGKLNRAKELTLEREGARSIIKTIPPANEIESALSKIAREIDVSKARSESIIQEQPLLSNMDSENLRQARQKRDAAKETIERCQETLMSLERESGASSAELMDIEASCEETVVLEEQLARVTKRRDALLLAMEILEKAAEEFRQTSVERIGDSVSEMFTAATSGRYIDVTMDESYNPIPVQRDLGPMDLALLSAGTRDQLYLASRMAIVKELSGRDLPLILDDPLVHTDALRKRAMMDLLMRISSRHQVILLTHDETIAGFPGLQANILRLKPPVD